MLAEDKPKIREPKTTTEQPIAQIGSLLLTPPMITWEKLPDDFILPDDPVDNIQQPSIAAMITEALLLAGLIGENALTCTDYGIIATVNGKTIAKAPDWAYIANITVPIEEVNKSYTPHLQGDVPTIVLEFLSDTDGTEFSTQPDNPMGKWYYYEQILKVPYYGIFEPNSGDFQVYVLGESGSYDRLPIDESGRYWIEPMQLSIAAWKGFRQNRMSWWLRWWDANGTILPWGTEKIEAERQRADEERQRADEERQRADEERQRADRLAQRLRDLGLDPD
jgi:Putative restriction endonuclease